MNLSDNVTVIEREGRTWYIIGTAHVSNDSVHEVRDVIEQVAPDTVCIELCETRYVALTDENRWSKLDVFEVIRQGKTLMLLANLAIGAYQRRLGAKLGVKPGAEMLEAARMAEAQGATVVLADRDIQVTLKRTWANVGYLKRMGLMGALFESLIPGGRQDVDAEQIEQLKERENLSNMMDEFARVMPEVKQPLIDERDLYMVSKLREAPGERIVAVVGAGHVPGMIAHFDDTIDRQALEQLPQPSTVGSMLKWVIPMVVLAAFAIGVQRHGGESIPQMLQAWILPNMVFAGVLTLAAGAKLPSVFVAAVGSPITSMNPLLPIGVPVGYLEARLRKPTVEDAERIPDDVQSVRGFYRNPFTRVLLVVFMSIMGSALGAWVGLGWLIGILS